MCVYEYLTYKDSILPILARKQPLELILPIFNQLFVALFFLFGITNIIIAIRYAMIKDKEKESELAILQKKRLQTGTLKLSYCIRPIMILYLMH